MRTSPGPRRYRIAGIGFAVKYEKAVRDTKPFQPFITDGGKADVQISVQPVDSPVDSLAVPQGNILYRNDEYLLTREKNGTVYWFYACDPDQTIYAYRIKKDNIISIRYLNKYQNRYFSQDGSVFYHARFADMILPFNRLILHASYIHTDYGGILFSGPSGVGKSTQADLWIRYRECCELINGDKPVIGYDQNEWKAYGSPFAGSSRCYVNKSDRIRAIVILEQASENRVDELSQAEAFRQIFRNAVIECADPVQTQKASDLITSLIQQVPVYRLACTPDQKAVDCLTQVLRK